MIAQEKYTLSNGLEVPKLGLGTWLVSEDTVAQAVKDAIELGYRHIDTAQAYQNERGVGEGIRASGVDRNDIFITTKVAAEIKNYKEAAKSIDQSLELLGLDYIDLMIIHSPKPWEEVGGANRYFEGNREVWRALEGAYKEGKIKSIGVSNFEKEDIENILSSCEVEPTVNQILVHISNTPKDLIEYCKEHDILIQAYSPLGHGKILKNPQIQQIAEKYKVSVPQLSIKYGLQLGLLPLPKSTNPDHMKSNADLDFEISKEDMTTLLNMKQVED
ncbi:aldo/keto reductase [bacterium]|nr:aldo/keto reductase [bacterium]